MDLFVLHHLKLYIWVVSSLCGQTFSGWLFLMPHALLQACWHCKVWADLADWLVWDDTVRISVKWLLYVLGSGALTTSSLMKWNVVEKKTECTWVSDCGAMTRRCVARTGLILDTSLLHPIPKDPVPQLLGWLLAFWGFQVKQAGTNSICFQKLQGHFPSLVSKPPATRGRECYIFMALYVCGDVCLMKNHRIIE